MTIPQNVKDAVKFADAGCDKSSSFTFDMSGADWQTIRAHLLSQEAEIDRLRGQIQFWHDSSDEVNNLWQTDKDRLAAANAQLRLMHRVLSQAVCVACADDGSAKDHELDKLDGVLRDQGWITSAVVPSTPTDEHLQGTGDEA